MEPRESIDLMIIGAGMHGLAMAKTYLEVYPEADMLIIDRAHSLGGSWAKERLYAGLKTNNIIGSYELSDYPMTPEKYGIQPGTHIPGEVVHKYFCDVAAHFQIDSKIRYRTAAEAAKLQEDGTWNIQLYSDADGIRIVVNARKLVIATGLTSEPHIPIIPGRDIFQGLVVHSKQLKEREGDLARCRNVVVLGGNKSSWDVCYTAARSGAKVHMVIRPSGGGPSYLWPRSFSFGLWKTSLAALSGSRIFMLFDPTPFGDRGPFAFVRRFLHRTALGAKICNFFWRCLDLHVRRLNGFNTHPEMKKLEPWSTPFWLGNSLSIHNYATDWFQLVREGKISVHITDVKSLSQTRVNLSDGQSLAADALVCCTGWKADPSVPIYVNDDTATNILRPDLSSLTITDAARAEQEIHQNIPYLSRLPRRTPNAPAMPKQLSKSNSPSQQLYRLIVPWHPDHLSLKNLAFIGAHSSPHAVIVAQAQALWITAYLSNAIENLRPETIDLDAARYDAIKHSVYGRIRRPRESGGAGEKYPDLVFDSVPYVDVLLGDLGLEARRKKGWWREVFERYGPGDYVGVVGEWVGRNRRVGGEE